MIDAESLHVESKPERFYDDVSHAAGTPSFAEDIHDAAAQEHTLSLWHAIRLYPKSIAWSLVMSTAIIMEGYDTILLGSLYAQPAFAKAYGVPVGDGTYQLVAPWQSGLNSGSAIGQLAGLLIAGHLSEQLGFKKTMLGGLFACIALIFITVFAPNITVLLVGQILFGIALGIFQTIPCIYALEVSPTSLHAYLTNYVNFCWTFGQIIATGLMRGVLYRTDEWAYRIPFAGQWFWPIILIPAITFAPESPWWLVRKGRLADAKLALQRLTTKTAVGYDLDKSITLMVATTERERRINSATSYWACFADAVNLRRTLIVIGVYIAQMLSGVFLRGYSSYFLIQAGLPADQAFNLSIVNFAVAILGGFCSWILLPLFGRRSIFLWSFVLMLILLVIVGGLGVPSVPAGADNPYARTIGAILIVSSFLYNCTMGPLTNTLCAELPSALLRSKSLALARWAYAFCAIIFGVIVPYQLNPTAWNWGAKTGFFWAGGCLVSILFTYFCLPEPKGRNTVELDILFEKRISARKFAETRVDLTDAML
ncbi:hypothetical protein VHEMI06178 [[Torrubiella] hemipterigena]|uniref:Major facilitator superfamily (MFS) profile domain-containing protein n=1 Tax=[Torrubiella] hemipterigena TaxID=1531966 RepID=A0A0A1TIG1_9HYPO|nr:hypothetical protein VHEMI06178 [[Torrubiella] hemipterigena]